MGGSKGGSGVRGGGCAGLNVVSGTGIAAASLSSVRGVSGSEAESGLVYQHSVIWKVGAFHTHPCPRDPSSSALLKGLRSS